MATINNQRPSPTEITRFLGLNLDTTGDTGLKPGESPAMSNFYITENWKLRKRPGTVLLAETDFPVDVLWSGTVDGTERIVYASAGWLYRLDPGTWASTALCSLGTFTPLLFGHSGKLYIADTTDFRSWDGTTVASVAGYRPLVAVSTPPAGGGTALEANNLLTGAKRQWFSSFTGTATYQVRETAITSIDWVKLNGVTQTTPAQYTINLTNGTITFVSAPATGNPNNVEIAWTKTSTSERSAITSLRWQTAFGSTNDVRLFGWGDPANPRIIRHTGLADGIPSAEYWPALGQFTVGSPGSTITDAVRQQDRLSIFTDQDAWYASATTITDALGRSIAAFAITPLHGYLGQVAPGQTRLVNNAPVTLTNSGVQRWETSGVKDERSATYISKRVQPGLAPYDLSHAITFDWDTRGEMWILVGDGIAYIWNYRLDAWYRFDGISATGLVSYDGRVLYGNSDGIHEVEPSRRNDNGVAFTYSWESGNLDFGALHKPKYCDRGWIAINPDGRSEVDVQFHTDNGSPSELFTAAYQIMSFSDVDFEHFSFSTNQSPQPFRFGVNARRFNYGKVKLSGSHPSASSTVLSISLAARLSGGETR